MAGVRGRQARHGRRTRRSQAQAVGHGAVEGAGVDGRADPGGVRRVRVDARHPREGSHHRPGRRAAGHLPQAASRRAAHEGGRPDAAGQPLLQRQALRPGQGGAVQDQQEARSGDRAIPVDHDGRRRGRHDSLPGRPARRADLDARPTRRQGHRDPRRGRRHRPLRQPTPAQRGGADPEPGPYRALPDGARRPRADDDPGRRGRPSPRRP